MGLCLFPKNPAHYFADLAMIENEEVVRPSFANCTTGDHKDIQNVFELTAAQMKALCTKKCNTGG